jgi:hypothetical protein
MMSFPTTPSIPSSLALLLTMMMTVDFLASNLFAGTFWHQQTKPPELT